LHLKADIFYNISEDGFESMQTYTPEEGIGEKVTKEELDQAKEGEFSTLGFSPCVHASVWICIYHCGMWALINGIAGVACSAICGYAFAYACS
jgi:putative immunity protein/bacteriocin